MSQNETKQNETTKKPVRLKGEELEEIKKIQLDKKKHISSQQIVLK